MKKSILIGVVFVLVAVIIIVLVFSRNSVSGSEASRKKTDEKFVGEFANEEICPVWMVGNWKEYRYAPAPGPADIIIDETGRYITIKKVDCDLIITVKDPITKSTKTYIGYSVPFAEQKFSPNFIIFDETGKPKIEVGGAGDYYDKKKKYLATPINPYSYDGENPFFDKFPQFGIQI